MAHILVAAMPFGGHVPPVAGVATALVERGHRVTFHTGAKYRRQAQATGATWLPWRHARDFDDADVHAAFPRMRRGSSPAAMISSFEHVFFNTGPGQLEDLRQAHAAGPFDAVLGEATCVGPGFLHDAVGVPWATLSLSPLAILSRHLPPPGLPVLPGTGPLAAVRDAALRAAVSATLGRGFRRVLNAARREAGLAPTRLLAFEPLHSAQLLLAQGVPALEYPRPDPPTNLAFVGDTARTLPSGDPPRWLAELDERPIVHVTQGTLDDDPADLYLPAIEAFGGTGVQLVLSWDGAERRLPARSAGVIAPGWVPHDLLLPRTSVMICNGGYGAVLRALSHGVPVIVAPAGRDKPEVARRVHYSGAGIDLRRRRPRAAQLRDAVRRAGSEPVRAAAARVAGQFAAAAGLHGPPS